LPRTKAEHRQPKGFDLKNRHFAIGIHFLLATNMTSDLEQKVNIQPIPFPQGPCAIPPSKASNIKIAYARSKTPR
jgi:hypothetical protein